MTHMTHFLTWGLEGLVLEVLGVLGVHRAHVRKMRHVRHASCLGRKHVPTAPVADRRPLHYVPQDTAPKLRTRTLDAIRERTVRQSWW